MNSITFEQLVALGGTIIGAIGMVMTFRRDSSSERRRLDAMAAERAAERQVVTDKLDSQTDMIRETRDTVREMNRQLADHSREIASMESRMGEFDRRLTVVEKRCERRGGVSAATTE
jgi:chromosome segregation ATPase